ncbi:MAG TPA: hypothetical protein VHG51_04260 [Longimicrobiaceae bacterium]|nr:hypothetical protein [Longimicrobiaceae bacterium]
MDEARLAFETLVVGLFGLVWILVLLDLWRPRDDLLGKLLGGIQKPSGTSSLVGLLVLPVAYVVGAVEFPAADWLFNKDDRFGFDLPVIESDDDIKVETYLRRDEWVRAVTLPASLDASVKRVGREAATFNGSPKGQSRDRVERRLKADTGFVDTVRALYDHQKFVVLQDEDGYRLLKPWYDQVVILRGTVLNAFLLAVVTAVGIVAAWSRGGSWARSRLRFYRPVLPVAVVVWGASVLGLMEAEREYDKHIVGTFYAIKLAGAAAARVQEGRPWMALSHPD